MFGFADASAERAFQLQYAGQTATIGLIACSVGLFTQLLKLFKALWHAFVHSTAAVHAPLQVWARTMVFFVLFLLRYSLGKEAYILHRGIHCAWTQVLCACNIATVFKPQVDSSLYGVIWHHRALLFTVSSVVWLAPVEWYWFTSILCWLVAAGVDVADPTTACGDSLSCLLAAGTARAADPWLFLRSIVARAFDKHAAFAVDVMLPGLLLTCYEARARRSWQRMRQQRASQRVQLHEQQAVPSAGSAAIPATPDTKGSHRQQADEPTDVSVPSCSKAAAGDPNINHKLSQLDTHSTFCRSGSHAQATPGTPGVNSSPFKPPGLMTAASQALAPEAGPGSEVPVECTSADASSLAGPITQPAQASTSPAPALQTAPAHPAGSHTRATGPSADATTAQEASVAVGLHSVPTAAEPPAGPLMMAMAGTDYQRRLLQTSRPSLLYRSPLDWQVVSFKFNYAPSADGPALQQFEQQMKAALQTAAQNTMMSLHAADNSSQQAAFVSRTAAFPGCYQLLMQLWVPSDFEHDPKRFMQELQQHIMNHVQRMLTAWQDVELISVSLGQLQMQQQQHAHELLSVLATGVPAGQLSSASALGDASLCSSTLSEGNTFTDAIQGIYLQPVAAANSVCVSQDATARFCDATFELVQICVSQSAISFFLSKGMDTVRVVVAPQQPGEQCILDQTWRLQDLQRTAHPASLDAEGATAICDVCLPVQNVPCSMNNDSIQPQAQVLTVVVLVNSSADSAQHMAATGSSSAVTDAAAVASIPFEGDISAAAPLHGVIACFPLLCLPADAANELQQLSSVLAGGGGVPPAAVYQQLLPMLCDFAAVLCTNGEHEVQQLPHSMCDSLSAYFMQHDLQACKQLVDSHCTTADAPEPAVTRTSSETAAHSQQKPGAAGSMATEVSQSCSGSRTELYAGDDVSCNKPQKHHVKSSSNAVTAAGGISSDSTTSAAAAAPAPAGPGQQDFHAALYQSGVLHVTCSTVLYGFPAPVEDAYQAYKAGFLKRHDLFVQLLCVLGTLAACAKLVVVMGRSTLASGVAEGQVAPAAVRALFVTLFTVVSLLGWLDQGPQAARLRRVGVFRQWSVTVLYAEALLIGCISAACLLAGGDWTNAVWVLIPRAGLSWWPVVIERHVSLPLMVCAAIGPDTVVYLALQLLVVDPVVKGLAAADTSGVGPRIMESTTVVSFMLHTSISVALEVFIRKSFMNHVAASRPQG